LAKGTCATKYSLEDGLLYRELLHGGQRLCIPSSVIDRILYDAHDAQADEGHNGVEKTVDTVSARFYWPHIFEMVKTWIRGCSIFLRVEPKNQISAELLSPLEISSSHCHGLAFAVPLCALYS
jgi:hypothetical protein